MAFGDEICRRPPMLRLFGLNEVKKILSHLHLRDCGTERPRSNTYLQSPLALDHSGSSDGGMLRSTCYVWYPRICSRYHDHDGTESRICISEEKAFLLSARALGCERKKGKQGTKKTDVRNFPAKTQLDFFCQGWSRARKRRRVKNKGRGSA